MVDGSNASWVTEVTKDDDIAQVPVERGVSPLQPEVLGREDDSDAWKK